MAPRFFKTPAVLRKWFEKNHDKQDELWVGFYKKDSGKTAVTYKEALDLALCFGWIDGIKKKVDEESYTNRFTPRRKGSNWSDINIRRVNELIKAGQMHEAGLAAFRGRKKEKTGAYAYQKKDVTLDAEYEKKLKANKKAWADFSKRPPGYRRLCALWVMEAKREETRERRLATLIECSAKGEKIPPLG